MVSRIHLGILVSMILSVEGLKLPEYLEPLRCSVKKDLEKCFAKSANKAIPLIIGGIPDYHLPKMNPLVVPFIQLISTPSLGLNLTNVNVHALENMKLLNVKFNWEEQIFSFTFKDGNITIEGDYVVNGHIMVLPIKGNGHFSLYLKNGIYKLTNSADTIVKNGDEHHHLLDTRLNYIFEKVQFEFDNLFDGNKQLGDEMNKFLNENWELLLVDFGPGVAETISSIIGGFMKTFLEKVPKKNIYLE